MTRWLLLSAAASALHAAGPYPPGPNGAGTDAIAANDPAFTGWASVVTSFAPGPQTAGSNASPANYGTLASALGPPDAAGVSYDDPLAPVPVLSLGDGGQVTLRFSPPIVDGEGADFAVFENGFATFSGKLFAELAFVEVSADGVNFTRFPAVSCTQTATQTGNFGSLDPADLHNLAGKHPAGYGTPFDLAELGLTRVTHVRLVDVVGDVKNGHGSRDSTGNWINDPWPTNFQTSGFDLDAVGVRHAAPDAWTDWLAEHFDASQRADASIAGPDADPDSDGKSNLVEYACGFAPNSHDPQPALNIASMAGSVSLTYQRHTDRDVEVILQHLTASGWQAVGGAVEETGAPLSTVRVTVPAAEARRTFRLQIVR
jgi:hypothetical protein